VGRNGLFPLLTHFMSATAHLLLYGGVLALTFFLPIPFPSPFFQFSQNLFCVLLSLTFQYNLTSYPSVDKSFKLSF